MFIHSHVTSVHPGAGQAARPGDEVPHSDRREELPKVQQQHERGEQVHVKPHTSTSHTKDFLLQPQTFVCLFVVVFHSGELCEQELLHISEPDLVYVDGPPHSPCPSSAFSSSSSHIPSPDLCPVRLQEVNLN